MTDKLYLEDKFVQRLGEKAMDGIITGIFAGIVIVVITAVL